ncbi:unnamed protein product [Vicia faba]|uniref:PORR domain-containing protein n=1 Tax=Vicia faba TaxID=3906 RepID=A0AAV0ZE86_VICFA|nr:unnamed protein product [Vicia faba]
MLGRDIELGENDDVKPTSFIRRYPNIFVESYFLDSDGSPVSCFGLSPVVLKLHREELDVLKDNWFKLSDRLCRLLMLMRDWMLPLQTIDQLKWDLGLIVREECFSAKTQRRCNNGTFAFPVSLTIGFGLKRKIIEWLKEWHKLPYTSPYIDASHLDIRTDVSEKRVVKVFNELLHLTLHKQTERKNVRNLRKPLALPQKFTKAFERHPVVFYISKKNDTQTVVLREAYNGTELVQKHPLVKIREEFAYLMKKVLLDMSRGVYKKSLDANLVKEVRKEVSIAEKTNWVSSKDESDLMLF